MPNPTPLLTQAAQSLPSIPSLLPLDPLALKVLGVVTALLFFKMLALGVTQGAIRLKRDVYPNPEDAAYNGKNPVAPAEHPDVVRVSNAYRNDLENIPIFIALAWAFLSLHCSDTWAPVYFGIFTLARFGHSWFYLKALQPWRALAFAAGALVNAAMAIQLLAAAFH
ncbi:MAG: hypothetical protein CVV27_06380 [Candidatus Melainabacteria bacterium HGW-Melainabacteria-1]|nr:MAG: hypothetical protein CVV27_06380 [Candidatus Melainabacteria bacterium HGW-Melainabacteria-1]